jgi:hypothetical protein
MVDWLGAMSLALPYDCSSWSEGASYVDVRVTS